jgi:hypothetical protein
MERFFFVVVVFITLEGFGTLRGLASKVVGVRCFQHDKIEGKIVEVVCKLNTPPFGHPSKRGE